jgi:hypothetical protein
MGSGLLNSSCKPQRPEQPLLLPGSLLMAIGAELFAPFMLIDFALPAFL